jgi:hypothetical protein
MVLVYEARVPTVSPGASPGASSDALGNRQRNGRVRAENDGAEEYAIILMTRKNNSIDEP